MSIVENEWALLTKKEHQDYHTVETILGGEFVEHAGRCRGCQCIVECVDSIT